MINSHLQRPYTGLVYREDCGPPTYLKTMLKQKKPHVGQDEKKMTPEVDSLKMTDLILVIIYNVLLTFWTFAYKSNVFYHGNG